LLTDFKVICIVGNANKVATTTVYYLKVETDI